MTTDITVPTGRGDWVKATRSGDVSNCIELHRTLGQLRDSKNAGGPVLAVNVPALVAAVKAGQIG